MGGHRVNADVLITEASTFKQAVGARRAVTWGTEAGELVGHRYQIRIDPAYLLHRTLTPLFKPAATLNT
jgi:hypothetical protein